MTIRRKAAVTSIRRKAITSGPKRGGFNNSRLDIRLVINKGPLGWPGQEVQVELSVSDLVDLLPVASTGALLEALREKVTTEEEEE